MDSITSSGALAPMLKPDGSRVGELDEYQAKISDTSLPILTGPASSSSPPVSGRLPDLLAKEEDRVIGSVWQQIFAGSPKKLDISGEEVVPEVSKIPASELGVIATGVVTLKNVEASLFDQVCYDMNRAEACLFAEYLAPNEGFPQGIKSHLEKIETPGLIVSAGTERSFFDLCLCDITKCEGLVVRDINPKVKAYVDFNVMLLRISGNREEYKLLSEGLKDDNGYLIRSIESRTLKNSELWDKRKKKIESQLAKRIEMIKPLLEQSDIPAEMKAYYLKNLEDFGLVYFGTDQSWKNSYPYDQVHYFNNDKQFEQLQAYAKAGKITATIGSVNDLNFLDKHNVALVDVSNIPDYALIGIQQREGVSPLIIWTYQDRAMAEFFSSSASTITLEEAGRREVDQLLKALVDGNKIKRPIELCSITHIAKLSSDFMAAHPNLAANNDRERHMTCYTQETLDLLREYCRVYGVSIEGQ